MACASNIDSIKQESRKTDCAQPIINGEKCSFSNMQQFFFLQMELQLRVLTNIIFRVRFDLQLGVLFYLISCEYLIKKHVLLIFIRNQVQSKKYYTAINVRLVVVLNSLLTLTHNCK